ncbi:type 1 glutamine amidotransferase [Geomonas sp.]|uniref:type 1 glutamine amidotransferase n=1 Tax=Geomonas sp. TaxID=2651584 RepID=UPI002B4A9844|nr:type 1 glutamine amidotransferase [Geomonas sp.]HJV35915.1 type 1 glutamine amidotransferase [Geomonas sp.]
MFLIIQNDPECPAGTLAELISSAGHQFRTLAAYRDSDLSVPDGVTGIIVLGGDMGVHDTASFPYLARVGALMRDALASGTPLLGICLGGQLLAHVAGGRVSSPSPHGEKGICRVDLNEVGVGDPLFAGVQRSFVTFQLHQDSFTVPAGGVLLASSAACPAQAFRLGAAAYALQFHPEVDRAIVSNWGALSTPPADYLAGFLADEEAFNDSSRTILSNFLTLACSAIP